MNELSNLPNFLLLPNGIATSGQPSPAQFAVIKNAGYELVINLAAPNASNFLPNESDIARQNGLEYVHIPVEWNAPQIEEARDVFRLLEENRDRRTLVHCAMNMRVSAFLYLYRTLVQGENEDAARADMERLWTPNETWQNFIDNVREQYTREQDTRPNTP